MPTDVKVPPVGESITEGTLARWLKKDGATVHEGDPLFELETDKATGEIPSPGAGVLRIGVKEGETVTIGAVVGRIEEGGDGKASQPAPAKKPATEPAKLQATKVAAPPPQAVETAPLAKIRDSFSKTLVSDGAEQKAAPPPPPVQPATPPPFVEERPPAPKPGERETRHAMSRIRRTIAERLVQAQHTAASLTTFNEADVSQVIALRNQYKDGFKERHGVGLGFMSFFVKAAVEALKAYPVVNSRIEGNDVVTCHYYDVGVAVSTDRGLMVPVLRDADRMTFAQIERAIADYAARAREGKIKVEDLQGGTFTITNGGIFGSLMSTPILNPPQSGILGMHTIQKRPVVVNDGIVIRPMMYLALSYDHRLVDGKDAVLFLVKIKEVIEYPLQLFAGF